MFGMKHLANSDQVTICRVASDCIMPPAHLILKVSIWASQSTQLVYCTLPSKRNRMEVTGGRPVVMAKNPPPNMQNEVYWMANMEETHWLFGASELLADCCFGGTRDAGFSICVHMTWCIMFGHIKYIRLVGGFIPFEKYDRQIGAFPQGSGWKYKNMWVATT